MSKPLVISGIITKLSISLVSIYSEFDFAFSIAKVALKEKVADIHLKKALHLEDEVRDFILTPFTALSFVLFSLTVLSTFPH